MICHSHSWCRSSHLPPKTCRSWRLGQAPRNRQEPWKPTEPSRGCLAINRTEDPARSGEDRSAREGEDSQKTPPPTNDLRFVSQDCVICYQDPRGGRRVSQDGQRDLDRIASNIAEQLRSGGDEDDEE
ncbi:40S ribosomal protein S19 [Puccinia graminis f. sp. tritici]|uniref:40S ribosomal protein S19 n=1 Tax=Puccinia graminis f. sp. tritici TaxID=56615 RepID=A0A5B0Q8D2_PUCGR|nr:40S ribosomal protein S19 [Puccinia graminis f. sp. tritici]